MMLHRKAGQKLDKNTLICELTNRPSERHSHSAILP